RGEATTVASVPTASMLTGNFSGIPGVTIYNPFTGNPDGTGRTAFLNNTIPAGSISSFASALNPFIPAPNQQGFADNFIAILPYANDWQKADGRLDAHFTDSTYGFLRYGFSNANATENSLFGQSLGLGSSARQVGQNAVIDVTHTFSPNLLGDARFAYNRFTLKQQPMGDETPIAAALGLTGAPNTFLPNFQIAGLSSGFTPNGYPYNTGLVTAGFDTFGTPFNTPQYLVDNTFNWDASGSWHRGRH